MNAPLTIYIHNNWSFTHSLSHLSAHIGRIQGLIIVDSSYNNESNNLTTFLDQTFPALRTLEDRSTVKGHVGDPLAWRLVPSRCRRLHHLSLGGLLSLKVLPNAIFPSLRTLQLKNDTNPCFTLPQFIQFLSRHPYLQELSLIQYSPNAEDLQTTLDFPTTIKRFTFIDSASYVKTFLSSFKLIPSDVNLSITHQQSLSDHNIATNDFITCILPDSPSHVLQTVSRVTSVEFTGRPGHHYSIIGRTQPHNTITLIELTSYVTPPGQGTALNPLNDLARFFCGAPVTELRLEGHMMDALFPPEEWMAFLDAFPLLAHVSIEPTKIGEGYRDARTGLFKALFVSDAAGGARWPHLRRFTLACGDMVGSDEKFFHGRLPRFLTIRSEQGAKVSELHFLYKHEVLAPEEGNAMVAWTIENTLWSRLVDHIRIDFVSQCCEMSKLDSGRAFFSVDIS